jgi:hypothetical protein
MRLKKNSYCGFRSASDELFIRNDVRVTGDLLPTALLFHPNPGKAEMFGFSSVRHLPTPDYRLVTRHDGGIAVKTNIFDLPIIGSNDQETGGHHAQYLLLIDEAIQGIGDYQIIGPQTRHFFGVVVEEGIYFLGIQATNFLLSAIVFVNWGVKDLSQNDWRGQACQLSEKSNASKMVSFKLLLTGAECTAKTA